MMRRDKDNGRQHSEPTPVARSRSSSPHGIVARTTTPSAAEISVSSHVSEIQTSATTTTNQQVPQLSERGAPSSIFRTRAVPALTAAASWSPLAGTDGVGPDQSEMTTNLQRKEKRSPESRVESKNETKRCRTRNPVSRSRPMVNFVARPIPNAEIRRRNPLRARAPAARSRSRPTVNFVPPALSEIITSPPESKPTDFPQAEQLPPPWGRCEMAASYHALRARDQLLALLAGSVGRNTSPASYLPAILIKSEIEHYVMHVDTRVVVARTYRYCVNLPHFLIGISQTLGVVDLLAVGIPQDMYWFGHYACTFELNDEIAITDYKSMSVCEPVKLEIDLEPGLNWHLCAGRKWTVVWFRGSSFLVIIPSNGLQPCRTSKKVVDCLTTAFAVFTLGDYEVVVLGINMAGTDVVCVNLEKTYESGYLSVSDKFARQQVAKRCFVLHSKIHHVVLCEWDASEKIWILTGLRNPPQCSEVVGRFYSWWMAHIDSTHFIVQEAWYRVFSTDDFLNPLWEFTTGDDGEFVFGSLGFLVISWAPGRIDLVDPISRVCILQILGGPVRCSQTVLYAVYPIVPF
ncbi:hypothetical protein Pelo_2526 [Pelomyxa schiedti]|nr:hypothetical protein Pelo_2526 [Pelomyxa schiedti]